MGALHTWRVLRSLALWIADDWTPPFNADGMRELERQILTSVYDDAIRLPLAVIARGLTPGAEDTELERMGYACLCVAEWAHARGFNALCLSFAHASALATGMECFAEVATRLRSALDPHSPGETN